MNYNLENPGLNSDCTKGIQRDSNTIYSTLKKLEKYLSNKELRALKELRNAVKSCVVLCVEHSVIHNHSKTSLSELPCTVLYYIN